MAFLMQMQCKCMERLMQMHRPDKKEKIPPHPPYKEKNNKIKIIIIGARARARRKNYFFVLGW